ncbi:UDP-glucose 6-dehydrogenase [Candidatus Woesearchaeota archaeon]|jgi:UDPglucose 6-dehydrogenase|nr:UDP-glucose 6-dehydrogenase [Candidatus Woesearchaeota archaeon]|tara:strand:+ start:22684 stop:23982 length:1299 start_codon:yes stop_codon:yes gene_type:complete
MKIAVAGAGYVGLVTAACFAELGNDVICIDIDEEKIKKLNNNQIPIYEPGLEEIVIRNKKEDRLKFTTDLKSAIKNSEIIFICVGTPPKESGEADLSYVENVARTIAEVMDSYKVIVEKSTVPVHTGDKVAKSIKAYNKHKVDFDVVSNPEFLREGSAVTDFMQPDRVVIGCESEKAEQIMKKLYEPLKKPILFTDIKSAEIIKHASNSFLATKISFINAIANICEITGADVEKVAEGMGLDKRIGKQFLNAGIGYGGFCFPKDAEAFIRIAEKIGYDFKLLKATQEINTNQKADFVKKIEKALWVVKGKAIGVLGLAFKPNTDDMRFAPSIDIIKALQKEGAKLKAYDPEAMERSKAIFKDIEYCSNPYDAAKDADALIILTEWNEFKELDLNRIKSLMKHNLIVDGRNIYNPEDVKKSGFSYISIGRRDA